MASCPACGADITHAKLADGSNVPLEKWTDPTGDRRYRIVELGPPLVVEKVSPSSGIDAYPDHRLDCPAFDNGLSRN
jgi:hypothetical protein